MHKEAQEELRVRLKWVVLELAIDLGVTKACREFVIPRSSYYRWKQKYQKAGQAGRYRERPLPIANRAEPLLRWLRKFWNCAGSIN